MRTRPMLLLIALLAGACTGGGADPVAPPASSEGGGVHDVVVLQTDDGSIALDTNAGDALAGDPGAVATFDGSLLFQATADEEVTSIDTIDPLTGDRLATSSIPGELDVRVASVSGELVALMRPFPPGIDAWTPVPRAETTIVVADPATGDLRRYELEGNYEPEAFSEDDRKLFLIEYLPAEAPAVYRVMALTLATGEVRSVFAKFATPPERMPGIRLSQVYDPVKARLYTLYSNEAPAYLDSPYEEQMAGNVTFVHVLSLRNGWAYCAGVPTRMWGGAARDQAMAVAPDGTELYIVDTAAGLMTVMDTRSLELLRTEPTALGDAEGTRASAAVSTDGTTLFVGSSSDGDAIYRVDTETLAVLGRWDAPGSVGALGLSSDGLRLYAVVDDQIAEIDPSSGAALGSCPAQTGIDAILGVHTPAP